MDEHRPGHRAPERRRVEVRLAAGGEVERAAAEGDQALVDQLLRAVDEDRVLRPDGGRASRDRRDIGLVGLPEVGRQRVRQRALLANPGDRDRRVEPA